MDQAHILRDMVKNKNYNAKVKPNFNNNGFNSRVITITSGKGGVGKTNFVLNLGISFALQGLKVIIIDADFGLANIEVLFGNMPKYSFADLLYGDKKIDEIITEGPGGIKFISGGSGFSEIVNLSDKQISDIFLNLSYIDKIADIILIDTGAGISKNILSFVMASEECIIVTTPEPTSITDAYSTLKTIKAQNNFIPKLHVVVNRVDDDVEGENIFLRLSKVTEKFLNIKINYLGFIPYDKLLVKSVKIQEPISIAFPTSDFNLAIKKISNTLLGYNMKSLNEYGIKGFVKRLFNFFEK